MELEVITTIINTIGFPIAVCVALFWTLKQMGTKALNVMTEFKEAINNNTNSINLLISKINGGSVNVRINK